MMSPPFRSDLFYSVQHEDYLSELAVLRRTARRLLMVASAGRHLLHHEGFDRELAAVERGPWFRVIAAGFRA